MIKKEIKLMSVELDDTDILIRLPVDLLIFAQENRPETSYIISDKNEMIEYFKEHFLNFVHGRTADDGSTDFEILLDSFFDEAIESGELWLDTDDGWMED